MEDEIKSLMKRQTFKTGNISMFVKKQFQNVAFIKKFQLLSQSHSTVLETTKQSLDQELLKLQKLQDESHQLTALLTEKEDELIQLKKEKTQLQIKGYL